VAGKRVGRASEPATFAKITPHSTFHPMSQQPNLELLSREDRIILPIIATKSGATISQRRATAIYNVPRATLQDRRAKTTSRRDSHPNSSKLTKHEEETIIQTIKRLGAREFAPTLSNVREIANQLLAARVGSEVREK
jgi:hypothetical protein